MAKYIYNNTGSEKTYLGVPLASGSYFLIPQIKELAYANNSVLLTDILSGDAKMSDNGTSVLSGLPVDHLNFLKETNKQVEATQYPFASKTLSSGKKLYKRVHGQSASVTTTQSSHKFTVPYVSCKITGVEIINAEVGDFVDFYILDTITGTVTTVPSYPLNQFGYNVYMSSDFHREVSNYDADLFMGLQVEVKYTSISSKTVYFNYILHELKD